MTLDDLYERLAIGELTNLAIVNGGVLVEEAKSKVVLYANDALKRLYTRFPLKTDQLFLQPVGWITRYSLSKVNAKTQQNGDHTRTYYIQDTASEPFSDDVIKVLSVYNRHGFEVPLNKPSDPMSVFTLQPTLLQIPHPGDHNILAVMYQAYHPFLTLDETGSPIQLPEFLMEALTSYIASKVFSHMNGQENVAKSQEFMNTFETICVETEQQDLVTLGTASGSVRFCENGWR